MNSRKNIDHIIANIVTRIALSFPVAYIQSISFFNGKRKIAFCKWENIQSEGMFQFYDIVHADVIAAPTSEYFQTVVVNAIDMNGCVIKLTSPCIQVSNSY